MFINVDAVRMRGVLLSVGFSAINLLHLLVIVSCLSKLQVQYFLHVHACRDKAGSKCNCVLKV